MFGGKYKNLLAEMLLIALLRMNKFSNINSRALFVWETRLQAIRMEECFYGVPKVFAFQLNLLWYTGL